MKLLLIFLFSISMSVAARADLTICQQAVRFKTTNDIIINDIIIKIHGNKLRHEQLADQRSGNSGFILISDLTTLDSAMLIPKDKTVMKQSGAKIKSEVETFKKQLGEADAVLNTPPPPVDTGKFEKIGDYETKIYSWIGPRGTTQTLWVAKDFPGYAAIKADRDKIDEWEHSGVAKGMSPDLRLLPGMVVKTQTAVGGRQDNGQLVTVTLVSVKIEPVNPSVFEVPVDYADWKP